MLFLQNLAFYTKADTPNLCLKCFLWPSPPSGTPFPRPERELGDVPCCQKFFLGLNAAPWRESLVRELGFRRCTVGPGQLLSKIHSVPICWNFALELSQCTSSFPGLRDRSILLATAVEQLLFAGSGHKWINKTWVLSSWKPSPQTWCHFQKRPFLSPGKGLRKAESSSGKLERFILNRKLKVADCRNFYIKY